jgi:flagellar basal body-associated protein FliL
VDPTATDDGSTSATELDPAASPPTVIIILVVVVLLAVGGTAAGLSFLRSRGAALSNSPALNPLRRFAIAQGTRSGYISVTHI